MPIRWDVEQGGEYLVPYAKKELARLKAQAVQQKLPRMSKKLNLPNGELFITVSTVEQGVDYVRITGTPQGWLAKNTSYYTISKELNKDKRDTERVFPIDECSIHDKLFFATQASDILSIIDKNDKVLFSTPTPPGSLLMGFLLTSSHEGWAVSLQNNDVMTMLSTKGAVFTVSASIFGLTYDVVDSTRILLIPIGIRNNEPYVVVRGYDDTLKEIVFGLISPSISTEILRATAYGLTENIINAGCEIGGSIVDKNGDEHIEVIFYKHVSGPLDGIIVPGSIHTQYLGGIYGYSTKTGLNIIREWITEYSSLTSVTGVPYDTDSTDYLIPTGSGYVQLRDRFSTACTIANGHINCVLVTDYTQTNKYTNSIKIEIISPQGIISEIDLDFNLTPHPSIVESGVLENPEKDGVVSLTYIGSKPSALITVSNSFSITPFMKVQIFDGELDTILDWDSTEAPGVANSTTPGTLGSIQIVFQTIAKPLISALKLGSIIFLEYYTTRLISPGVYNVEIYRQLFDIASSTRTDLSMITLDTTSGITPPMERPTCFLGSVMHKGHVFMYAIMEDTPETEPLSTLRPVTESPMNNKLYLVTLDNNGKVVHILKELSATIENINNYPLEVTYLTCPKAQKNFTIWNNRGDE